MKTGVTGFGVALLAPIAVLYAVFLLAPIGNFLATSLLTYDAFALYKPVLTGANFSRLIFDPYYRAIILLTMKIALLSTVFSLIIGFALAYFLARTQSAWRGVLMFLVVAPLMTGVIVRTYGWIVLLGAEGTVNSVIVGLGLVPRPVRILNTEVAVVIALVHILLPYMVFPLFSAYIGWLGVFLTGSDASTNSLFGPMQVISAQQLNLNPILAGATNTSGGAMGKMISPQNLSIGATAIGQSGKEGSLLRQTFLWSLLLTAVVGVISLLQATILTAMIPSP